MPWSVFVCFERGQPGQMPFSVGSATAESTQLGRLAHFGNQFILVIACEGILVHTARTGDSFGYAA